MLNRMITIKKLFELTALIVLTFMLSCNKNEDKAIHKPIWTSFTTSDGLLSNYVTSIAIDRYNNKWFGTADGASELKTDNTWNNLRFTENMIDWVYSIAIDKNNIIWLGTDNGLVKLNSTLRTIFTTSDGLINNHINKVAIDNKNNKWLGTFNGVSEFRDSIWTNYTSLNGLAGDYIYDIMIDRSGHKWFNTGGGLSFFDGKNWSTAYEYTCFGLAADKKGNIWIENGAHEILKFDYQWNTILSDTKIIKEQVSCIVFDDNDNIWIGTLGQGVVRSENGKWLKITTADGLVDDNVNDIRFDNSGTVWFATSNGISSLKNE